MKKQLKYSFILLLLLLHHLAIAQVNAPMAEIPSASHETALGFSVHTSGVVIEGRYGKLTEKGLTHSIYLGFVSLRHPKETRQRSVNTSGNAIGTISGTYIYGKIASLYALRGGYSGKYYFVEKTNDKGIAIGMSYAGGASLGLVKPYYLNLRNGQGGSTAQAFTEENSAVFLNNANISGASGFSYGWNEVMVKPGVFAKLGINFDWGNTRKLVKSIEAGIMLDAYFEPIELMILQDARSIYPALYATFQLGKRW